MDQAEALLLLELLSPERIEPYLERCSGDLLSALHLHAWNSEISNAFQLPLGYLELTLRNVLDARLRVLTGHDEWWTPGVLALDGQEASKVQTVRRGLLRDRPILRRGDMITELTFGFWAALLNKRYEVSLWRPALRHAFPGYRGPRGPLHRDLHHLRLLRNRVAHHEPIHHRHLTKDYRKILLLLGYMSPVAAEFVRAGNRVEEVLARRPDVGAGVTAGRP